MMPSEVERAYWARRLTTRGYVDWLAGTMDLPIDENMYGESKNVIDYRYQTMLSEKPAWVEAAEEVLIEAVQEEPDVPVEEDFEPDDPMEEPDVPVEEDIVDEDGDGEPDSPFEINTDYDAMTVVELRDICRERGLTVRGTKAEIVLRLRRDDDGIVEEETVETDNDETEAPAEAAAEESSDAPSEEEAATEEVTTDADSGETSNTDEEE